MALAPVDVALLSTPGMRGSVTGCSVYMQATGRDAVTPDNHSGFWHQRYTLRSAAGSGKQDNAAPGIEEPTQDTPVFLQSLQGAILTTGETLVAMNRNFVELHVESLHEDCWSWSSC